jgi:hypothetical protein
MRKPILFAILIVLAAVIGAGHPASAQHTNPRFGKWKLKQEPPALNVMTYEPLGATGMKVTVESTNAKGEKTTWWYTTEFDGKDMPVTGQGPGRTSAVRKIDDQINEVVNKTNGKVTQVLYNVLSKDGQSIGVMYYRDDGAGKTTNITFAMYEKMP